MKSEFTRRTQRDSDRADVRSRCIGRETELDQLLSLADAARYGEQLAIVEGGSGSGKSHLLQAFHAQVRLSGGVVLEGRCEPGSAFGPFATVVERALGFLDEMGASTAPQDDLGCFAGCHALWHQHPRRTDLAPGHDSGVARERRLRFFDAIRRVLTDVARFRPPVVLLHDLERADAGTLQLLRFLFEGSGPWSEGVSPEHSLKVLVVTSVRTGLSEPREELKTLYQHKAAHIITLGPFDQQGVREFLTSDAVVEMVLSRTGGIPEAMELLLAATPLGPGEYLGQRLEQEPDQVTELLEMLAVLNQPAELSLLDELVERLEGTPSPLVRSNLVVEVQLSGTSRYTFARARHRELLYDGLSAARRTELHARCADVFADRPGSAMAAHHACLAGDIRRAMPLAQAEARGLADRHAHAEAASLLERTIVSLDPADVDAEYLEQLADLHRVVGDYRRAINHARALSARGPGCALAALRLGRLLVLVGELPEAERVLRNARALAEQGSRTHVRTETLLAELFYDRAAYGEAEKWGGRAMADALARGDTDLEVHARNTLGKVALATKNPQAADTLFEENYDRASAAQLKHQRAKALTNRGVAMLRLQRLDEAKGFFEGAIELAEGSNDSRHLAIATENLAVLAHLQRDYSRALVYYHDALAQLKRLGNRPMLARLGVNLGALYLSLGDLGRAQALSDFTHHIGGTTLPTYRLAEALMQDGRIAASGRNLGQARTLFESAAEHFQSIGAVRCDPALELIRLDLEEGDVAAARQRLLQTASPTSSKEAAEFAIVSADIERAAGGATCASACVSAERAVSLAQTLNDTELILQASIRAAEVHSSQGNAPRALAHLRTAQEAEETLGACVPPSNQDTWIRRPLRGRLTRVEAAVGALSPHARRPSRPPPTARSPEQSERYPAIAGSSPAIVGLLDVLDRVAPSDATVLVRGESGTGKELVAEALHRNSPRKTRPLVKVNCAALVETLLLSELFGHERGAFTGANSRKKGRFELADGGTLFLDEIGDISPGTQVALLRVLQEREFERVGGTQSIKVDVRIVAATHRNLEAMVADGTFREDLYYRLRGVSIEVPALRDRLSDVDELCATLLPRIARDRGEDPKFVSPEVLGMLKRHNWPGNIRELENVLRGATLFADGTHLRIEDFGALSTTLDVARPPRVEPVETVPLEDAIYARVREGSNSLLEMKKVIERECIVRALSDTKGNITKAANLLGMKRPRLSQLVKQYGLESYKKVQS